MDAPISNAVSSALYMNQAQTAQQAQMQVFEQAMDSQERQVAAPGESSSAEPQLAQEGSVGTQINTYA
ncbi:putative motility protein [Halomonas sp. Bachu 37]|uniref:hypothetical protein n=1 Tax=Halomonas kashgarensis TaxID=3084920 RepID=UPI0032167B95